MQSASHKLAEAMYQGGGDGGDGAPPSSGDEGGESGDDDVIDAEFEEA